MAGDLQRSQNNGIEKQFIRSQSDLTPDNQEQKIEKRIFG